MNIQSNIISDLAGLLEQAIQFILNAFGTFFQFILDAVKDLFQWLIDALMLIINTLVPFLLDLIVSMLSILWEYIIYPVYEFTFDTILLPAWDTLTSQVELLLIELIDIFPVLTSPVLAADIVLDVGLITSTGLVCLTFLTTLAAVKVVVKLIPTIY